MNQLVSSQIRGIPVIVDREKLIINSTDEPPTASEFVYKEYRGKIGHKHGKFYIGQLENLYLSLQHDAIGELTAITLDTGEMKQVPVIGIIGNLALLAPKIIYKIDPIFINYVWNPDGTWNNSRAFIVDKKWIDNPIAAPILTHSSLHAIQSIVNAAPIRVPEYDIDSVEIENESNFTEKPIDKPESRIVKKHKVLRQISDESTNNEDGRYY